jgi:hypothetical protein
MTTMGKLILNAILARLDALETTVLGRPRRRLTKRDVAELEGIDPRSVMRGVKRGTYAEPEVENKRLYWWSDTYRLKAGSADSAAAKAGARSAAAQGSTSPRGEAARRERTLHRRPGDLRQRRGRAVVRRPQAEPRGRQGNGRST